MKLTGENRSTHGKTCPSANLFTTTPTWTGPGLNLGLRDYRHCQKLLLMVIHIQFPRFISLRA
jgi:hypothetical protein